MVLFIGRLVMTLPRWDDEMKFELLRLKSELRSENFRVLHAPIGLGALKKNAIDIASFPHLKPAAAADNRRRNDLPHTAESKLGSVPALPPIPSFPSASSSRSLSKLLIIHSLDLGFVTVTLGLGLLLASWLIDPGHVSDNPDLLRQALPMHFVIKSSVAWLVAGLYGFFSVYWLFFKLVSGSTLGESFLDNFWSLQNSRRAKSIKDSIDS